MVAFPGKTSAGTGAFPDHLRLGPDKPLRTINLHLVDIIEDI
jgi:hypothetical protein